MIKGKLMVNPSFPLGPQGGSTGRVVGLPGGGRGGLSCKSPARTDSLGSGMGFATVFTLCLQTHLTLEINYSARLSHARSFCSNMLAQVWRGIREEEGMREGPNQGSRSQDILLRRAGAERTSICPSCGQCIQAQGRGGGATSYKLWYVKSSHKEQQWIQVNFSLALHTWPSLQLNAQWQPSSVEPHCNGDSRQTQGGVLGTQTCRRHHPRQQACHCAPFRAAPDHWNLLKASCRAHGCGSVHLPSEQLRNLRENCAAEDDGYGRQRVGWWAGRCGLHLFVRVGRTQGDQGERVRGVATQD